MRFVIGIDLGTSNSALAYADLDEVRREGRPVIRELEVPQLVAPGDVKDRKLLPSAIYEPADFELPGGETRLPWTAEGAPKENVVGEAARRLGAKTPVRLVESAKSWLCHGGVNRTASILPWQAPDGVPKLSPVDASAAFLAHLRAAWDQEIAKGDAALAFAAQTVVVTVPASFDEMARQLTLEAAKKAGFPADVTLIEEPLSAFYAFIARTGGTPRTTGLSGGERVLVADVGGGTTDFTLIDVKAPEDGDPERPLTFERTAVGDHLLLGGDNMDLALAHAVEAELTKGKKLDAEGWAQLKLECRLAKEALFTSAEKTALPLVVVGRGSKLIGGTMRGELTREKLFEVVVDGYYPPLPPGADARPQRQTRSGLAEYGLPYASDPRITRHLAAFLLRHARPGEPVAHVDAILFNGGALKPIVIRDRLSQVVGEWLRASGMPGAKDPRPLVYDEGDDVLELAVARGAAYFGLVRAGLGVRVGGGSPREYFLGLGLDDGEVLPPGHVKVVCVAPRGMQEGQRIEVSSREFTLITNRPVQFPLYATTSPRQDPVGSIAVLPEEELTKLPPLHTVVKFGKQKAGTPIPVRIQVRRTELDTLELSCLSKMSGARFKLELDLRGETPDASASATDEGSASGPRTAAGDAPFGGAGTKAPPESGDVEPERIEAAKLRIRQTFATTGPRPDPDQLMKGLEADLALGRDAFSLPILRQLAEQLLDLMDARSLSPEVEARWLNVTGFCLRPGFGVPVDDWRVRQLWKIYAQGVLFPGREPCELNWWILWRRVAGGLARGHQEELSSTVFPLLIPSLAKRAKQKPPRPKSQEAAEMWRAAASLERIGAKSRAQLGDALVELIEEKKAPKGALWCLGRIGARKLLYGPHEATVRAETAAGWAKRLMKLPKPSKDEDPTACLVALCRMTGDRHFDVDEETRRSVAAYLEKLGAKPHDREPLVTIVHMDRAEEQQAFGENLPAGLRLS
ncbi:hsp70 family protein [Myxococcota bacterium]|nr:hsp70 family protein [Myxococcota bacterium]